MNTNETLQQLEISRLANEIQEVRNREGYTQEADGLCQLLADMALIHSRNIIMKRKQTELKFQEAAVEAYVQRRESDEIFYNWVDDI
jgi:hypothetical protein